MKKGTQTFTSLHPGTAPTSKGSFRRWYAKNALLLCVVRGTWPSRHCWLLLHPASSILLPHCFAESNTTTNKYAKRTHLIATLLAELVLRLEGSLLGPLVADGLLGLGKVQGWREGAHGGGRGLRLVGPQKKMAAKQRTAHARLRRPDEFRL